MKTKTKTKTKTISGKCAHHVQADIDQCFWINNGPVVRDASELKEALKNISDEQFHYHTKREGNDFAKWTEEVLQCKECAKALRSAKSKTGAIRAINTCCK
ncbi:MAG: hypothetical protein AAB706_03135 [Patescibacteria group bacterium]